MRDRVAGAPGQYKASLSADDLRKLQAGEEFTITMTRDDKPLEEGTPYSKAAVLPDEVAKRICPNESDPTPAQAFAALRDMIYPVGSVYISTILVDPENLFGGKWKRLKDRFLLAAGDEYKNGSTGGAATHTLTKEEMPSHQHNERVGYDFAYASTNTLVAGGAVVDMDVSGSKEGLFGVDRNNMTGSAGDGKPHNNMPPYVVVYMWEREE